MTQRFLRCHFLSYWHPGTGGGLGAWLDARARSMHGLPVVPGRTLKGVLRDAVKRAEDLGWLHAQGRSDRPWVERLFGQEAMSARSTVPGGLRIGSAELDMDTQAAFRALDEPGQAEALRGMRAALYQTAIDDSGVAKEGSLRGLEVYVPMPLVAPLEWIADTDATEASDAFTALARSLPLVEGLGAHRTRGLGRVALTLENRP
jgi:CRISPR/Cas system CSM-associated protein Csm3 (group 7 of RAMP superfamily)